MAHSLDVFAEQKLKELSASNLHRVLTETDRSEGIWIRRNGRRLLSFSCNDYLNLTQHPDVKEAAIAAIRRYGVGAGASRLVTGNHPLFAELEARLAHLMGMETACVFGSGYLANAGIVPALVGKDDLVLVDELAHGCLWAGAQLSRGKVVPFRHNDLAHVEALLNEHRQAHGKAIVLTDGVFSQDGDIAPLEEMVAIADRFDTWVMSDDAHGIGVVGQGRGSTFATGRDARVPLKMGTLGKAVGSYGGYLAASAPVIDLIRNRARTYGLTTGQPPGTVAATIASLRIIADDAALVARPLEKAKKFAALLGMPEPQAPIVPIIIGDEEATLNASRMLAEEGFFVTAIRPPTVPRGTARLRILITASHPHEEIERLATLIHQRVPRARAE
ncbi:aminotransferase class I/II-fold pyridoxal phosphate-dependent enzyme (plasmid) [Burkholderia sp. FERM BP-3421]|uniref:aminotransferase class I/II-fold pyridoxal phosphate-dependent enzyme n=1 Tax=Burkholderia sp. FERM BP-3421 TaxID=1494466 RepID=UPI002362DE52|nr:aminotransferase class I/II-fold pyridoxal phosphate-dependent enzyme [Burkholderia sp. FERM BP-3421]WDD90195.1 aminotransferase class I/II-fold pyridoxal phosphate-dependent enzyme [Burkholderia sp. FERM BP-3421]